MYVIGDDVMRNRRKIAALGALSLAFGLYQSIKGKEVKSIRRGEKKIKGIFNKNQKKADKALTKAFKKGKKIVNVKPGKGNFIFKKK